MSGVLKLASRSGLDEVTVDWSVSVSVQEQVEEHGGSGVMLEWHWTRWGVCVCDGSEPAVPERDKQLKTSLLRELSSSNET